MNYFFGDKPLDTEAARSEIVKKALASEEAKGATEAVPKVSAPSPQATHANVAAAIAAISRTSRPNIVGQDISKKRPSLPLVSHQMIPSKVKGKAKGKAKRKAGALPPGLAKQKEKTHFPPGLVVSEKAKAKMAEHQAKMDAKLKEKEAKKAEQKTRWQARPDVQERWKKWEQKQQTVKDRILAKWDAQDKKLAAKRSERLARLADKPEEAQKEKNRQATKDVEERIKRAHYMARVEEKQLRAVKKREHAQVRRDRFYNFVGGFLGWEKRAIPLIPAATLAEWHFNGWEL